MTNTTNWPSTVRALGDMAEQRGMKLSELIGVLERELGPIPPAAHRLTASARG